MGMEPTLPALLLYQVAGEHREEPLSIPTGMDIGGVLRPQILRHGADIWMAQFWRV